jgi:6-pyruvoyltetrahydropterin/6-carboxytetrahydropterin synthase
MELTKTTINGEVVYRVWTDGGVIATFHDESQANNFVRRQMPYTINKKYHFYASHRNETLSDKCYSLHGHNYRVTVGLQFEDLKDNTKVTMLFSDIDSFIEPIIKELDHASIWNVQDPFYQDIKKHLTHYGMKTVEFDYPTSVENMCTYLFERIEKKGLPIRLITIQETESSIVTYEK